MEGIVTLLDGFYADLVPKSLEAGLSLILQDLGPLLFLHLFSCFFFFGFYNLKLPLRFLSSLHNSHRKSGGILSVRKHLQFPQLQRRPVWILMICSASLSENSVFHKVKVPLDKSCLYMMMVQEGWISQSGWAVFSMEKAWEQRKPGHGHPNPWPLNCSLIPAACGPQDLWSTIMVGFWALSLFLGMYTKVRLKLTPRVFVMLNC